VLRVITRLNAGGPARHVVWLSEGLRERGWETRLLAGRVPEGEDDLSGFARERGVEVTEVPDLSREVRPLRDWESVRRLEAAIEDFDPHVVHTHTAKAGFVGRWAALRANRRRLRAGRPLIRVVHTFHGNVLSGYFSPAKSLLFRGIERQLARRATDAIVVLSPQQREDIVTRFRVAPSERTFLVPLAIDLSEYERLPEAGAFRSELGFGANEFVVGIVGRVAPVKNHELFLRAAALLARRVPGARFVVLGGGAGLEGLRRIASELGVAERVRFVGLRTDLPAVYAGLDAVALTSLNEGTPLSLIEAMSAGKPVVATDVGGVRDLLTAQWDGPVEARRFVASPRPRGLLVPSGEVEAFAVALERLAGDRSLRDSLGEAGRLYAFKYHGLPRLLEDVDRLYRLTLAR
jgi:glycosyltransferase involved in cell wall biosynthesis